MARSDATQTTRPPRRRPSSARAARRLPHAPALLEPVDRRDVRMIQRRERLGLALKARESIGGACEGLWQDLDRDITIELGVARPVYLAHSAFADLRGDFVDAEA